MSKQKRKKIIHFNNTPLPLKYRKEFGLDKNPKGWGPDPGKLLMARQKYLRDTGQEVED